LNLALKIPTTFLVNGMPKPRRHHASKNHHSMAPGITKQDTAACSPALFFTRSYLPIYPFHIIDPEQYAGRPLPLFS
jgi:hypothetical protein